MTREEKLYSMTGNTLLGVAERLGLNVNKNILKQGKGKLIEKIMEAEGEPSTSGANEIIADFEKSEAEETAAVNDEELVPMPGTEDPDWGKKAAGAPAEPVQTRIEKPKRGQLIEYKGKSQNICKWAKELGKSANTLYARIYKLGWSVEDAFTK